MRLKLFHEEKLISYLYVLLIFFMVFDGVRDAFSFSSYLSILREGTIGLTFLLCLFMSPCRFKLDYVSIGFILLGAVYIYGIFFTIEPIYQSLYSISEPLSVLYKHIQFFMMLVVFSKIEVMTGRRIEHYMRLFVIFSVIYAIITPYIFFHPPSFMIPRHWWGRIGIGYPTMDAQIFCYALVSVLYILNVRTLQYNLAILALLAGVFMQATATGIATALVVLSLTFVKDRNKIYKMIPALGIVIFAISTLLIVFYQQLGDFYSLLIIKFNSLMNPGSGTSTEIRNMQLKVLDSLVDHDFYTKFFGIGTKIYVENQYSFFKIAFGLFGFFAFCYFIFVLIVESLKVNKEYGRVLFISIVVFCLTSKSLVSFYLYPIYGIFSFFIAYFFILKERDNGVVI